MNLPTGSENRSKTDKRLAPRTAFKPGKSGNPGGRPKKTEQEYQLEQACKTATPEALAVILELMRSADKDTVRLQAATFVIERAYGKAVQPAASLDAEQTRPPVSFQVHFVSPEDTRRPKDVIEAPRPTPSLDGPHRQNPAYLPSSPDPLAQFRRA